MKYPSRAPGGSVGWGGTRGRLRHLSHLTVIGPRPVGLVSRSRPVSRTYCLLGTPQSPPPTVQVRVFDTTLPVTKYLKPRPKVVSQTRSSRPRLSSPVPGREFLHVSVRMTEALGVPRGHRDVAPESYLGVGHHFGNGTLQVVLTQSKTDRVVPVRCESPTGVLIDLGYTGVWDECIVTGRLDHQLGWKE